jgi:3'-phosphoadenosine 5'-phosphosulfate sulfotransferase (PAPS reductase)/FAD synthetase
MLYNKKEIIQLKLGYLKQRQSLDLASKIVLTQTRIRSFYNKFDGNVYISFSGGKDSTVLLHIARSIFPDIEAVYVDTGLEFPEIRNFVKTINNVTWIYPVMPFNKVIEEYGYPVISKEQSQFIQECRTTKSEKLLNIRMNGDSYGRGKISKKWQFLINAPFKISDKCCNIMKKQPLKILGKKRDIFPIIGTLAQESRKRSLNYLAYGCNTFNSKIPTSRPISFWLESDIWQYIKEYQVPYSKIYDMGYERTGCMFCMYGCHLEKEDRFERMKVTHPIQYKYCMEKLRLQEVIDFVKNGIKK